jgi:Mg2+ and Co2+ transporter CorA
MDPYLVSIRRFLREEVLGLLALCALTSALVPLFFPTGAVAAGWLAAFQWMVVGVFLIEYVAGLILAESKRAYIAEPLRLLVAATLVIAFASLLDSVPDNLVAAPSLNVIRVVLAAVFGLQAGALTVRHTGIQAQEEPKVLKEVSVFDPAAGIREASWLELLNWCERPTPCWYHAENIALADLPDIAKMWHVPLPLLQACLGAENYPRVDFFHETILLSVWLRGETVSDSASPVVLLLHGDSVLSVSRSVTRLTHRIETQESEFPTQQFPFASRMAIAVLELALRSSELRINTCETQLREMERTPIGKARPALFTQAYEIKQELSALYADLWRLKGVVTRIKEGEVRLSGASGAFGRLMRHIEFLYTTVENLRHGIISLIELHMNNASFEMTKFMRLLAVVNVLALIPAVVGGLLGMNILGAPWALTLPQVGFFTLLANIFCLYYFAIKGWLR